jgi:hypothetical protein
MIAALVQLFVLVVIGACVWQIIVIAPFKPEIKQVLQGIMLLIFILVFDRHVLRRSLLHPLAELMSAGPSEAITLRRETARKRASHRILN